MNNGSQFGEIQWIINNVELPKTGTVVEIGAADGLENSNSYELERLGWKALLVEPDYRNLEKLRANRPSAIIEDCAVSVIESNDAVFFLNPEPTWSGLTENLPSEATSVVKLRRLDTLLDDHKIDTVNILSIDTEGTELQVWKSRGHYRPDIVIIEFATEGLPSNSSAILKELTRDNYQLVHTTECNHVFVRKADEQ